MLVTLYFITIYLIEMPETFFSPLLVLLSL